MCAIWFNILWTFVNILWTFVNICEHFGGTYGITHKAFSVFCAWFVNILCTFVNICEHLCTNWTDPMALYICVPYGIALTPEPRTLNPKSCTNQPNPKNETLKPKPKKRSRTPTQNRPKRTSIFIGTRARLKTHTPKTTKSELRFLSDFYRV